MKQHFRMSNIQFIGKVNVILKYYVQKFNFVMNQQYFFLVEVIPQNSRIKKYKFIFSQKDIEEYCGIRENNSDIQYMDQIIKHFIRNLILLKDNIYKRLCVKKFNIQNQDIEDLEYYYLSIKQLEYEKKEQPRFIKKKIKPYRVLYHKIINYNKVYCIVTVQQSNFQKKWILNIYSQKSGRNFSS